MVVMSHMNGLIHNLNYIVKKIVGLRSFFMKNPSLDFSKHSVLKETGRLERFKEKRVCIKKGQSRTVIEHMIKNSRGIWIAIAILGGVLGFFIHFACLKWLSNRNRREPIQKSLWNKKYSVFVLSIVFLSVIGKDGLCFSTIRYLGLICVLFGASLIDSISYQIPNRFLVIGILWWFVTLPFAKSFIVEQGVSGLFGAFFIGGGVLFLSSFLDHRLQRESIGGGDVKLFCLLGLYFGIELGMLHLIISCIMGILFVLFLKKERIPFVPAISISAWIVVLFGKEILSCYWSFFFSLIM